MSRPATKDRQRKPVTKPVTKPVGLARIKDDPAGVIECSCGASKIHPRAKVRGDWGEAHVRGKHRGRGIWI